MLQQIIERNGPGRGGRFITFQLHFARLKQRLLRFVQRLEGALPQGYSQPDSLGRSFQPERGVNRVSERCVIRPAENSRSGTVPAPMRRGFGKGRLWLTSAVLR